MPHLFRNDASTTLADNVLVGDSTITVSNYSNFPPVNAGEWFTVVVQATDGTYEIMKCTARSDAVLTVARAQELTVARAFTAGDIVEVRLTSAALNNFMQKDDASVTADLDMNGYEIINPVLNDITVTSGTLADVTITDLSGTVATAITIPDGGDASIGGNKIWHEGNDGAGSGLAADLLDGSHGAYYLARANHTGTQDASTITGLQASATTDTTNADNITNGTLGTARLEGKVLRWGDTFINGNVRLVTSAPANGDGLNGDIWLVVAP